VFALYFERAGPDESGRRSPMLRPLRLTAWAIVSLILATFVVFGLSLWWFSDPDQTLYTIALALFLLEWGITVILSGVAVWFWLS